MGLYKAASCVSARAWIREKPGLEARLLGELTNPQATCWMSLVATEWIDVVMATHFFDVASRLLFPEDPLPVRRLGREMADDHLKGVYRFMVRLASPETVLDQTGKLWDRYHDTGTARLDRLGDRSARLIVTAYPGLPERMRENIAGYCGRAIELTGADNVRCMKGGTPEEWQWNVTWK
jgi:hypothetical protein